LSFSLSKKRLKKEFDVGNTKSRPTHITISDLLDYSRAEEWLGSFYQIAVRGLDADLELYELLDLDTEGVDDQDFPQVDDVLDE
jgi:hypothetical protein